MAEGPILIWYWGRLGAGPLITKLLAERLIAAGLGDRLVVSLAERNEMHAEIAALGVQVRSLPTFQGEASLSRLLGRVPALRAQARDLMRDVGPRTVVAPMMFGALLPVLDVVRRGAPRLLYMAHDARRHPGDRTGRLQHLAQALIVRACDRVIAPSAFVAEELVRLHPRQAERIVAEPLASLYPPSAPARGPVPADRPVRFLVPGRLVRYKGFERLAAALRLLPQEGFTVTVVGDGPYRGQVEALLSSFPNVTLDLRWWDPAEQARLYGEHDWLLCPYDEASQSGTICEALAAALPSLVTPVGALPEQIGHGRAGLVSAGMGADDLSGAMRAVIAREIDYARTSAGCLSVLRDAERASRWADLVR